MNLVDHYFGIVRDLGSVLVWTGSERKAQRWALEALSSSPGTILLPWPVRLSGPVLIVSVSDVPVALAELSDRLITCH